MKLREMKRREFFNESVALAAGALMVSAVAPRLSAKPRALLCAGPIVTMIRSSSSARRSGGRTARPWRFGSFQRGDLDFHSGAGAANSPQSGNVVPDVINYAWREYGMRVGLWRMADVWTPWECARPWL